MTMPRLLCLLLAVSCCRAETSPELREMVRRSLAGLNEMDKKLADYGFVRRGARREFYSDGRVKTERSWLVRREFQDGFMVNRLLERNGKPIPEEDRQKNEAAIQKRLAELKAMTPEQLKKLREANRKKNSEDDAGLNEFPEALDYKKVGEESINGRPALVLQCSPRPGYKPKNFRARIFEKVRGRMWIDKADSELVRADVEAFDTVSIGFGILGRIEKGTRFMVQRQKWSDSVWLPQAETMKFAARVMLVKNLNQESTTQYTEFRHRSEFEQKAPAP